MLYLKHLVINCDRIQIVAAMLLQSARHIVTGCVRCTMMRCDMDCNIAYCKSTMFPRPVVIGPSI